MGARADEGTRGFGELLRLYRRRAGLSQEELAALSGLSSRAIAKMESGQSARPYRRSVLALADALQLPGYQRAELAQASRPVLAATDDEPADRHAAPVTLPEVRYSLPPDTPSFTGRQQELGLITAAAAGMAAVAGTGSCGIVAIGGMPGVGKTALAVHAARLLAGGFPDRQLFLDLRGHTPGRDPVQAADALAGLLSAAGLDPRALPADLDGRAALWRDRMAGRRALLVLDNAASSAQVEPLLPGGQCLVLLTSRRHLSDLPGAVLPVTLEVLQADEAVHMLTRMAPRTAADDPAEVADLARLAGFLPLAIALLARVHARHPAWRLADLIAETRQTLLTLSAEHASVAAAFEVSWARLEPAWRDFAALLGLHPGTSVSVHAAAALAAVPVARAAALLDGLHGEGLLAETGYRRYGMHDLIRRYAAGHAAADLSDQDRAAATARLLDYYQQAAAAAQALLASVAAPAPRQSTGACALAVPDLASADDALGWVRAERAGLLASLDQATKTGQHARVVALTAGIAELLFRDGPWAEAIARHAAAAQAARELGDRAGQAGALISLGEVRRRTADYPGAAADLTAGMAILRELGDRPAQARSLIVVAATHGGTGDYDAAAGALEESLAICRDLDDQSGQARALASLGYLRVLAGDYRSATPALAEALAILRIFGDRAGQADTLRGLGQAREGAGDYAAATRDVTEALVIYRELGDRAGQASVLGLLGGLRSRTGDYPAAELVLQEALEIYRDLASRHGQANVLTGLGGTCRQAGQLAAADEYLSEALAIYRDIGDRGGEVSALNEAAAVRLACGDHATADRCFEQALVLARQIGSSVDEADALAGLGRTARAAGDVERATDSLRQAFKIYSEAGAAEAAGILADLECLADANIV